MSNSSIRYGVVLRKRKASVQADKSARYACEVCGRTAVKRQGNAIWKCRHCNAVFAGGAYTLKTPSGENAIHILQRIKSGAING
ncbi:MAG: 50S ribosomal protein L37ae [Candidatus Marsarchaeota archaeon]|jgi:large subunit ribosomal protein L37Ae|nr:50S ribosomal protein L37ae [Candidatus Marsarchaeota archaeon]